MPDTPVIRAARVDDARAIAGLFLISSDGLAEYIWSPSKAPGESLVDAGARRYARKDVAFSYENCLIAEFAGETIGMAHAFPMHVDPAAAPADDPVLAPYAALEQDGSFYISGLATLERWRGRGVGSALLAAVERQARERGLPAVSLICFEANEGAMRLYRREGYVEIGRRPLHPHPCLHYSQGDAVLLSKPMA